MRRANAWQLAVSALCGLALTRSLPPDAWWPASLAIAPLFALVARAERGAAALLNGAAFGLAFFAVYILWLPRSFAELFGEGFWFVFPPLVALLALFWGLTTLGAWLLAGGRAGRPPGPRALLLLPAAWVLVEWARTQGYFAFPWGTLGYAWLDAPPGQLAEYVGVYGLSLLTAVTAALLALPFAFVAPLKRLDRLLNGAAAGLGAAALLGFAFWQGALLAPPGPPGAAGGSGEPLYALLVQGNVDPFARAATMSQELTAHLTATEEGWRRASAAGKGVELVVWPEGAVTGYLLGAGDAAPLRREITSSAPGASFIVGGRAYERGFSDSYNSLFSLEGSALLGRYDKEYLVPFGERWPLIDQLGGVYEAVFGAFGLPLLAGTLPGAGPHPLPTRGGSVGAYICYESVFPQVQRAMVSAGAEVLVLGTNDAWFGVGSGARQHFDMGRMRAIETRRYLLRAGNDGITAGVDQFGRVIEELPQHVRGALLTPYELRSEVTFYVRHGHWWPALLVAWLLLFSLIGAALRKRRFGSRAQ